MQPHVGRRPAGSATRRRHLMACHHARRRLGAQFSVTGCRRADPQAGDESVATQPIERANSSSTRGSRNTTMAAVGVAGLALAASVLRAGPRPRRMHSGTGWSATRSFRARRVRGLDGDTHWSASTGSDSKLWRRRRRRRVHDQPPHGEGDSGEPVDRRLGWHHVRRRLQPRGGSAARHQHTGQKPAARLEPRRRDRRRRDALLPACGASGHRDQRLGVHQQRPRSRDRDDAVRHRHADGPGCHSGARQQRDPVPDGQAGGRREARRRVRHRQPGRRWHHHQEHRVRDDHHRWESRLLQGAAADRPGHPGGLVRPGWRR